MTIAIRISIAVVAVVIVGLTAAWWFFVYKKNRTLATAVTVMALVVAITVPIFAFPFEEAWKDLGISTTSRKPQELEQRKPIAPETSTPSRAEEELRPGYGPDRKLFSMTQPAPYPTLNSIVDNPNYGDERGFITVEEYGDNCSDSERCGLGGTIKVQPGREYRFQVYVEIRLQTTWMRTVRAQSAI